ncbi:sulfotransferase 1 family member D1-like [Babylonia areolata]|uniref:sulfotransferase 1 family member D1-like n=1 Tax=Babylonia areolata TaxID=304850 RepID=UPI003FD39ABB
MVTKHTAHIAPLETEINVGQWSVGTFTSNSGRHLHHTCRNESPKTLQGRKLNPNKLTNEGMSTPTQTAKGGKEGKEEGGLPSRVDPTAVKMVMYEGMMMLEAFESIEVQVPNVKAMELREDDILLCSYPKTGTHWMWRILDMLASGKAEYSPRVADFTIIDFQKMSKLRNVPSPRVLVTHYPFHMLPEQVGKAKVVHIYRSPKATMVSLMFMLRKVKFPDLTFAKLEEMFFAGKAPYGNLFTFWDTAIEFEKKNPKVNVFHVAYEDLKKDTAGTIQVMAEFLKVPASQQLCSQIAQAVSFSNQKTQELKLASSHNDEHQPTFYRKGEADDWKNHMTVAQSERLDGAIRKRADKCRFSRHYLEASQ